LKSQLGFVAAIRTARSCALADEPEAFARAILELLSNPEKAAEMARRARAEVVARQESWEQSQLSVL